MNIISKFSKNKIKGLNCCYPHNVHKWFWSITQFSTNTDILKKVLNLYSKDQLWAMNYIGQSVLHFQQQQKQVENDFRWNTVW